MAMPNGGVERLRAPYPDVLPIGPFIAVGDTGVADGPAAMVCHFWCLASVSDSRGILARELRT